MSALIGIIAYIAILGAALYGWVCNIITIFGATDMATGELIVRVVGVPIGIIGAFLGYF